MKNKKRAGFKMKKTPTKFNAGVLAAAGQKLNRSSQMPMPNYTPNIGQKGQRLKTWDDYFDQDRFDSRAVNKRLTKSQRQAKIARKKKAFEKRQAATLATAGMNPGGSFPGKPNFSDTSVPNPYAGGGGRKFQIGDFVDDGVRTMSAMAKKSGFTMKKGSKPNKSEFFKGKK